MIYLGHTKESKALILEQKIALNNIKRVVVLTPEKFKFEVGFENTKFVDWPEIIMYRTFYPLLQEIDSRTLVVVNECLRSQNRHDLTYNCIRHYLNQAGHVLVFQWLPLIDEMSDFMTLYDFVTGSRWKKTAWDIDSPERVKIDIIERVPNFNKIHVLTSDSLIKKYKTERDKLFAEIELKDPHTIPRNLLMVGSKARFDAAKKGSIIGRNTKAGAKAYKLNKYDGVNHQVTELPHNFIDLCDFSCLSGQTNFEVMVCDLPVDGWYFERFKQWSKRISNGYTNLQSWSECA